MFTVIKIAKAFVEIEAMTDEELKQNEEQIKSTSLRQSAAAARASSLQTFETAPEYALS